MLQRTVSPFLCLVAVVAVGSLRASAAPPAEKTIPIASPQSITAAAGSIWVASSGYLFRIDPWGGAIELDVPLSTVGHPALPGPIAMHGRTLWLVLDSTSVCPGCELRARLESIDVRTGRLVGRPIVLPSSVVGSSLVWADGALWLANANHGRFGRLDRIDPISRTVRTIRIPSAPVSIALAHGLLWVGEDDTGTIVRVDPRTAALVRPSVRTGGALLTLATGAGRVWVADSYRHRLLALDPATGAIAVRQSLPGILDVVAKEGAVWAVTRRELFRVDPETGGTLGRPVRTASYGIALAGGAIWTIGPRGVTRISA